MFIFLLLLLEAGGLFAQEKSRLDNLEVTTKTYNEADGFSVYKASSIIFDNEDWLWISGISLELSDDIIQYRKGLIQRFSGTIFQTIDLPNFLPTTPIDIKIYKRNDGQFYVLFQYVSSYKMALLNPRTLVFTEIDIPNGNQVTELYLFPNKSSFRVLLNYGNAKVSMYELTKGGFSNLVHLTFFENNAEIKHIHFNQLISFDNHFLLSDEQSGAHIFLNDGSYIKTIALDDLGKGERTLDYIMFLSESLVKDGEVFIQFKEVSGYFKYYPVSHTFERANPFLNDTVSEDKIRASERVAVDKNGIQLRQIQMDSGFKFIRYDLDGKRNWEQLVSLSNFANVKFRDLNEELFWVHTGVLNQVIFKKKSTKVFLPEESIRAIHQVSENELMVATEGRGWFRVNTKTEVTTPILTTFNGQPFLINRSRAIFDGGDVYWSSNNNGIVQINKQTNELRTFIRYPVADMIEDKDYIYIGTHNNDLLKFDKVKLNYDILASTKDYSVQGILKLGKNIYLASKEGLVIYEKGETQLFLPEAMETESDGLLIAIAHHKTYGLLLGSASGKLYQFDRKTKTFKLFYTDELGASIATILFDNQDRIWLNTYQGIVCFDPEKKTNSRFSIADGLAFNESNRYSAIKTSDGHFAVGSLKGLTYFHPNEIFKKPVNAHLRLVSMTYLDKKEGREVTQFASQSLETITEIKLPPENRNLNLEFSLLGMYNAQTVTYRYRINESTWINLGNKTKLSLFNLGAGDYTLEFEALDLSENRIGTPVFIKITAEEFFYKTNRFYFGGTLLLMAIGFWFFKDQRKKFKQKELFSQQIIKSQETERSRVAKELHDSVGQRLLLLKNTLLQKKTKETTQIKMVEDTIREVREMSHNLHPFQFEKLGLVSSLKNLISAFQKSSTIFYSEEIEAISGLIPKEKELFLFRMIQECISNVEKHSQATACNLIVTKEKDHILFLLRDNGKGFSVEEGSLKNSLGIKSLKERAQYINAYFHINSTINQGTTITIKVHNV